MFRNCCSLTCIPPIDTSNVISIAYAFVACYQLLHVPRLNTSQVTSAENAFNSCYSIRDVGTLDLTNLSTGDAMFYLCYSIERINLIGCSIANMNNLVQGCGNLKVVYGLDISQAETYNSFIGACNTLTEVRLKGLHFSLNIASKLLSKRSILYLIENEVAIEPIIITLASIKYNKYANDPEVLEALSNHPLITLASA